MEDALKTSSNMDVFNIILDDVYERADAWSRMVVMKWSDKLRARGSRHLINNIKPYVYDVGFGIYTGVKLSDIHYGFFVGAFKSVTMIKSLDPPQRTKKDKRHHNRFTFMEDFYRDMTLFRREMALYLQEVYSINDAVHNLVLNRAGEKFTQIFDTQLYRQTEADLFDVANLFACSCTEVKPPIVL